MKSKKILAVLTASCVALGAMGVMAEEVANYDDQIMLISEESENVDVEIEKTTEYDKKNVIGEFVSYADGQLTIKAETEYVVNVSDETIVINADAVTIPVENIKEGALVSAVVSKNETKSMIPQSNGFVVIVAEDEEQALKMPIYMESKEVETKSVDEATFLSADETYNVTISNETEVVPFRTRNIVKAADIKNGAKVLVYSEIMTMSIPALVNPYKVVVLDTGAEIEETVEENIEATVEYDKRVVKGKFSEYADNQINIEGESEFVININEDTLIIDENANVLSADETKEGAFVTATVSKMQTFSRIPQSYGYVVIISETEDAKVPMYMEVTNAQSASIDEATFLSADEEFEVAISAETEVTPFRTKNILKAVDIKNGAKVLVYSDVMTMSIPALVNPYKVIVLSNEEVVPNYEMSVNGEDILGEVIDKDGVKMLPLRAVCETMGMIVDWHEETNSVTVSDKNISAHLTLDINSYNGVELAVAPELINDKTYVPMSFFAEILNAEFDNSNFEINLTY